MLIIIVFFGLILAHIINIAYLCSKNKQLCSIKISITRNTNRRLKLNRRAVVFFRKVIHAHFSSDSIRRLIWLDEFYPKILVWNEKTFTRNMKRIWTLSSFRLCHSETMNFFANWLMLKNLSLMEKSQMENKEIDYFKLFGSLEHLNGEYEKV